jgi:hypothetical protein
VQGMVSRDQNLCVAPNLPYRDFGAGVLGGRRVRAAAETQPSHNECRQKQREESMGNRPARVHAFASEESRSFRKVAPKTGRVFRSTRIGERSRLSRLLQRPSRRSPDFEWSYV